MECVTQAPTHRLTTSRKAQQAVERDALTMLATVDIILYSHSVSIGLLLFYNVIHSSWKCVSTDSWHEEENPGFVSLFAFSAQNAPKYKETSEAALLAVTIQGICEK